MLVRQCTGRISETRKYAEKYQVCWLNTQYAGIASETSLYWFNRIRKRHAKKLCQNFDAEIEAFGDCTRTGTIPPQRQICLELSMGIISTPNVDQNFPCLRCNFKKQWLLLSWQRGCFQHQKSAVQIHNIILDIFYCQLC